MPSLHDRALTALMSKPGIKRDGTKLDGNYYTDGSWCRFRLGRPKKMGGYREIANGLQGPIRGVHVHPKNPQHIATLFSNSGVQCQLVDSEGRSGGNYDRTPEAFAEGNYTWTYQTLYDSTGTPATKIIAHAAQTDWASLDSDVDMPVYMGEVSASGALEEIPGVNVSGGIVVLQPFLFAYGSNGLIMNSKQNDPSNFIDGSANAANVAGTKIVRGFPLRGGANAPAGLFWALDALIRVSFVGGTAKWRYDQLSDNSTILCTNGIVDYDGVFFWPGVDRFLMYNGVVQEVQNPMNQDFFFDNMNWAYRQKCWATTLKRWGEIYWFFPRGTATECNHAIVYNVREQTWYDTPIERSAGAEPRVLHFPIWADSASNDDIGEDQYRIYRHETGRDAVLSETQGAIRSYFETGAISLANRGDAAEQPNVQTRISRLEPDFQMSGRMTVEVTGGSHAQGEEQAPVKAAFNADTPYVDIVAQRRLLKLRFESNESDGDYHMGKTLAHLEPGDPHQGKKRS